MRGLGTIINVLAIIVGGIAGMSFKGLMTKRFQETLNAATGVCVIFLGIAGAMEKMLVINNGVLESKGTVMLIVSMAAGSLIGEAINLDGLMEKFGVWLKQKTNSQKDNSFVEGFVNASLTVCIGAMAVVGSIQDGIFGDYSILMAKALLDALIIMIMAASFGKGCIFSAIPVGIFQGSVTFLAGLLQPFISDGAMNNLSMAGSVLIFCVGVNLVFKMKIKVANMLPAIFIAAFAGGILGA